MKKRFAVLAGFVLIASLLVPQTGARADIIDDILGCDPVALSPVFDFVTKEVYGRGRTTGNTCSQTVEEVLVCVDVDMVTWPGSCRSHTYLGGLSNPADCIPGYWQSVVIVYYRSGATEVQHTLQGTTVTTQCLPR